MATHQMNRDVDPDDRLSHCADKIAFITDTVVASDEELTERGKSGLAWVLIDIEDELRSINDEVGKMLNKRKEKKAEAGKEA